MISPVELQRIVAEWRVRLHRVKDILQPPTWSEKEWRQFSQALALMVRDHGRSWIIEPNVYWDLRWHLQEGGELICQIEHIPGEKTSLVVAQNGGFAETVGSYTWLWAEFNMEGNFARDPYWVEGTWKEALTSFLIPLNRQASYLLAGRAETPDSLLLQEGARPNDRHLSLMPGLNQTEDSAFAEFREEKVVENGHASNGVPKTESTSELRVESVIAITDSLRHEAGTEKSAEPEVKAEAKLEKEKPAEAIVEAVSVSAPATAPEQSQNGHAARIDTPAPFAIRWGMPQKLTWKDSDEIAYALIDAHPGQDPMKLSLSKLHQMVTALEDFGDDPQKSNEAILEAILMAWYEEVK